MVATREKNCGNYTKEHDKEIKEYWYHKTSEHTKKDQRIKTKNNRSTKQQENNEQNCNSKSSMINNYFKCKQIRSFNQKTEWLNGLEKQSNNMFSTRDEL